MKGLPIMSLTKSVSNITLEGAKVLIAAAEAKATEMVRCTRLLHPTWLASTPPAPTTCRP